MFQTRNDIPEAIRQNVVFILQKRLSDGIDLMQQAKHAHWNVKGPHFFSFHKLFDRVHDDIATCVDLMAERIAQLGEIAGGTCKFVAKHTSLPDYPLTITDDLEHIDALSNSMALFGKMIREGITEVSELNDAGTVDILTHISREMDKNLWFLENHLMEMKPGILAVQGAA